MLLLINNMRKRNIKKLDNNAVFTQQNKLTKKDGLMIAKVYEDDMKGDVPTKSRMLHNAYNMALTKWAHQSAESPTSVTEEDLANAKKKEEEVVDLSLPTGLAKKKAELLGLPVNEIKEVRRNKFRIENLRLKVDKTANDFANKLDLKKMPIQELLGLKKVTYEKNMKALKELEEKLPEELRPMYNNMQEMVSKLKTDYNNLNCLEQEEADEKNSLVQEAIQRLGRRKERLNAKERITELLGDEPSDQEVEDVRVQMAEWQKMYKRDHQEMKDIVTAVLASLELNNNRQQRYEQLQDAHRRMQVKFQNYMKECQRRADAFQDAMATKLSNIEQQVGRIDSTVNKRRINNLYEAITNPVWWYLEDFKNIIDTLVKRKGWINLFRTLIQPLLTSVQVAQGWLVMTLKSMLKIYGCLENSPLLCVVLNVGKTLIILATVLAFYFFVSRTAPYLIDGAWWLLKNAYYLLKWACEKLVAFVGNEWTDWLKNLGHSAMDELRKAAGSFKEGTKPIWEPIGNFIKKICSTIIEYCTKWATDLAKSACKKLPFGSYVCPSYGDFVRDEMNLKPKDFECFDLETKLKMFGYKNRNQFETSHSYDSLKPYIIGTESTTQLLLKF